MRINIVTPPHTKFAAICLANTLTELNHEVYVQGYIDYTDTSLHIIYCAGSYFFMPKNYILYQTEVHSSHWFNKKYLGFIKGAKAVWEYQAENIAKYKDLNKYIHIVPPSIMPQPTHKKDIDYLFYGMVHGSKHREQWIKELQKSINLTIVNGLLENKMWELLARSKNVLNIHYYPNAPLEIFRINEALSFGCNVVSETCTSNTDNYEGVIRFADTPQKMATLVEQPFKPKPINSLIVGKDKINSLIAHLH